MCMHMHMYVHVHVRMCMCMSRCYVSEEDEIRPEDHAQYQAAKRRDTIYLVGQSSGREYSGKRREDDRETHHPDGTLTSARVVAQLAVLFCMPLHLCRAPAIASA